MKDLLRITARFKKYWRLLLFAALFTAVQCAEQLCLPRLMAAVIDSGIVQGKTDLIMQTGGRMLLVCFVLAVSGYGAHVLSAVGAERFALHMRNELYDRIGALSVYEVNNFGAGSLITRLTGDVKTCSSLLGAFLQITIEPLLLTVGGMALVWQTERRLGLLFTVFVAVQILLMFCFVRLTAPRFKKIRQLNDRFNARLQEVFSRLRLIKILNREKYENDQFGTLNKGLLIAGIEVQKIVSVFQPLMMFIVDCAVAFILLFASNNLDMRMGNLMEVIAYAQQVLLAVVISGRLFQLISEAVPGAARISQLLDAESDIADGTDEISAPVKQLEFDDVSFAYPASADVLSHIRLTVEPGSFLAVTGATGSGKSTLADLCVRLFDVGDGRILLDGQEIEDFRLADLRRHIALVEKHESVLSGTFYDNIVFGRDYVDEADVEKAVRAAQCAPLLEGQPEGLQGIVYAMGRSLSGGERQRLTVARALAGKPDVLLLDDCTSSLDHATETAMLREIRALYPEMTVILFTQRSVSAALAQTIVCLDRGEIVGRGTDEELRETCPQYRELCLPGEEGVRAG